MPPDLPDIIHWLMTCCTEYQEGVRTIAKFPDRRAAEFKHHRKCERNGSELFVLTSLPTTPIRSISSSGETNARVVRPKIPVGAIAWRLPGSDWRPMGELPDSWMPFLNRDS